jgi:hypothetical protein
MAYLACLVLGVAVVALCEWRTDEDLITLGVLAVASFAAGAVRPSLFWLSGLVLGLVVPGLNLLTTLTGWRPVYETAAQAGAHGVGYALSLMILVLPALVFAGLGALARWALRRSGGGVARTAVK